MIEQIFTTLAEKEATGVLIASILTYTLFKALLRVYETELQYCREERKEYHKELKKALQELRKEVHSNGNGDKPT